ncbi:MAG: (Fe-S)-binding protein [Sulfuricaulis sp.]
MDPAAFIKLEAAKCVACGLCLPHCPTYGLLQNEAESPRGRLSLMLALAKNNLPLSSKLESHLARCLDCRACEKVCPSNVAYGQALDSVRALIEASRPSSRQPLGGAATLLLWLVEKPGRIQALSRILRWYQRTGMQRVLRASRLLRLFGLAEFEAELPALLLSPGLASSYPARFNSRGRIDLFTGCLSQLSEPQTVSAAIRLLTNLGYEVHVPPNQQCCGAIHLHAGQPGKASEFMRKNMHAFAASADTIVGMASGCTATLGEYEKYLDDAESARKFSRRVVDISQFLVSQTWPAEISFRPLVKRVAVHDPCTLTNVLRQVDKPYALLARIPGIEIVHLPENALCCGAAGTYHLTQTQIAAQLRTPKLAHLKRLAPDILVTSNSGCARFLAAGMREAGLAIEVIHPVVLLERQMQAPIQA